MKQILFCVSCGILASVIAIGCKARKESSSQKVAPASEYVSDEAASAASLLLIF